MDYGELRRWLLRSYRQTAAHARSSSEVWWPRDHEATLLSFAFFVTAARARYAHLTRSRDLFLNAAVGEKARDWIERLWSGRNKEHWPHESLLDFSLHEWGAANPILLTGESEVGPYWGVGDGIVYPDDYSWDFYKLLVVPSPVRLFFARVGGRRARTTDGRRSTDEERISMLFSSLTSVFDSYPGLFRDGDSIGGVLIPRSSRYRDATVIFWSEGRTLRSQAMRW